MVGSGLRSVRAPFLGDAVRCWDSEMTVALRKTARIFCMSRQTPFSFFRYESKPAPKKSANFEVPKKQGVPKPV